MTERGILAVVVALGLLAALLEVFLFNLPHWASLAGGEEIVATPERVTLQGVNWNSEAGVFEMTGPHGMIDLADFDTTVKTVWIEPEFTGSNKTQPIKVHYDDAGASDRNSGTFQMVDGVPRTDYVTLMPAGPVTRVAVEFDSDQSVMSIRQIVVNKTMPLWFDGIRFLGLWGLLVVVYLIVKARGWRAPFDPGSRVQKVVNGALVAGMIITLGTYVVWSAPLGATFSDTVKAIFTAQDHQYTRLVDAFLHGQLSFLEQPDPSLVNATLPYDPTYRRTAGVNYQWDFAYYDGKYYSYFGIVPALVLFLPWQAISGQPLSTQVSVFVFASAATWFLYLLWREVVKRWFPKVPYVLYALGATALFGASQLLYLAARPVLFETVISAGALAVFFGFWALLKATAGEDLRLKWLAAGAAGLALAVGCRPNLVFVSLLLPVLIWPHLVRLASPAEPGGRHAARGADLRSPLPHWRSLLAPGPRRALITLAIPYVVVAIGLMTYNAVRFGSIAEFGASYQLTVANVGAYMDRGFLGTVATAAYGVFGYLSSALFLNELFPFFAADVPWALPGYQGFLYVTRTPGALFIPLFWFLALGPLVNRGLRALRPLRAVVGTMLGLGLFQAAFISIMAGVVGRYTADFYWLFALPALVVMLLARQRGVEAGLQPSKLTAVCAGLLLLTLCVTFQVDLTGESEMLLNNNPAIFSRLQNMFRCW